MNDLPSEFVERLKQIIPDNHWNKVRSSFQIHKPLTLRINTLLTDIDYILDTLEQAHIPYRQVTWKNDALIIEPELRNQVLNHELYQQGLLYSQNLSSQLAPLVLDPKPGDEVLDMCAAPGGKTSQLACMMQDDGRIAAVEKVKTRFFKMKANFNILRHHSIHTYLTDAVGLWRKTPERFDRVLLDAPCASESRFQTNNPDSYSHWTLRKIKETSRKQKKLIYSAVNCLKPGGTLVYCTCSFAPEENEAVIDHILNSFPHQLKISAVKMPAIHVQPGLTQWKGLNYHESLHESVRILPDEIMNGLYICKILKSAPTLGAQ